jgi:Ca-activated chloride channel homolog
MSFAWPLLLAVIAVVPLLLAAYVLQLRKKRKGAVVFSNVALLKTAVQKRSRWKRHVPAALFLIGLCSLGVASARPQGSVTVPIGRTSIILALDVSRSMCATDVEPNRLAVAQAAAREFVKAQPKGTRIGIVAFAGFAELVVAPTTEKQDLIDAINSFSTGRGTVIGAAILKSLDAVSSVNPDVAPVGAADDPSVLSGFDPNFGNSDVAPTEPTPKAEPPKEGYVPDIVVLLTDGANTRGIAPADAAKEAASRRVRVYTIGFGTTNPTEMVCTAEQMGGFTGNFGGGGGAGGGGFGGGGGGGDFRRFLTTDEPTLQSVANATGGTYYSRIFPVTFRCKSERWN